MEHQHAGPPVENEGCRVVRTIFHVWIVMIIHLPANLTTGNLQEMHHRASLLAAS